RVEGEARDHHAAPLTIVLKMTVEAHDDLRTSFVLSPHLLDNGIGRDASNAVSVPADKHMAERNHAVVRFHNGGGYFISSHDQANYGTHTLIRDGELSRRHAAIWWDETGFYLQDMGSTNGTFMKLHGAYRQPYRLEIGDQILVSQTCFSVNRWVELMKEVLLG
ncbi:hypothetical protein DYB30_011807, partial [Aphanomyces astaci]